MENYYKVSGRINPIYSLFFLVGAFLTAVLSVVYSLLLNIISFIYVNIIITFGLGFLIGIIISFVIKQGKMRNKVFWFVTMIFYFIIFIHFHFAAFVTLAFIEIDIMWFFGFLLNPVEMFEILFFDIVPFGTWSFANRTSDIAVNGIPLVIIWVIEHVIIFVIMYIVSLDAVQKPFFEDSNCWGKEKQIDVKFQIQQYEKRGEIVNSIGTQNTDYFAKSDDNNNYSQFTYYCDPSEQSNIVYLYLKNVRITYDKKGKEIPKYENIFANLEVPLDFVKKIEETAEEKV